jgi:acetyltransferase
MNDASHVSPEPSTRASLDAVLNPESVAIIGASRDPTKRGYQALKTLLASGFAGRLYPVNPAGGEILGVPVATSVEDLPRAPDLAFICTPAAAVPQVLAACARRGIRGAVISAVGFRESGEEGGDLERQILEIVHQTGLRLVGPNTAGVLNAASGLNLVGVPDVPAGHLALFSQSGNVGLEVLRECVRDALGISLYVGVGNESDIAFHEYLEYASTDGHTRVALMYVEGFRDGQRFIDVARGLSKRLPIVLLKGGRSPRGVAAARSHTGAIAGSYPVLRAALRQSGVIEVQRSHELVPVGFTLVNQPVMQAGSGAVILSDGGGHGTLAADALAELGVELAEVGTATARQLKELLGRAASVSNPIDVAGAADRDPAVLARALEILAPDPNVGGVLIVGLFGGYAIRFAPELASRESRAAEEMSSIMAAADKPLVVHSLYAGGPSEPLALLRRRGVPVVTALEIGARCLRATYTRGRFLQRRPLPPAPLEPRQAEPPAITAARREARSTLMELEVRELLAEQGVPVVSAIFAKTADQTAKAAAQMGQPVVLKIVSPTLSHKTEAGGVVLDIEGEDQARQGFNHILEAAAHYAVTRGVAPDLRGVLVSPMLPPPVVELIVGVQRDEQYGPVLTVGAGGVAVEVLQDATHRRLPVNREDVAEMLEEIQLAPLLAGFRGRPGVDRQALVHAILGVAACALAHPEIEELEANPVFAYPDRVVVVDARGFLRDLRDAARRTGPVPRDPTDRHEA